MQHHPTIMDIDEDENMVMIVEEIFYIMFMIIIP